MISWPPYQCLEFPDWRFYDACPDISTHVISNKEKLAIHEYKAEPEYTLSGWYGGYSFKHFWSNCHFLLGEIANLDGVQQLVHHYYLQNGSLGAIPTVARIKKFLSINPPPNP